MLRMRGYEVTPRNDTTNGKLVGYTIGKNASVFKASAILGSAVDTISGKVDTINTHIDNVLKDAPTKLKVSVRVDDVDRKKIQDMFDKQHEWMTTQMQKHIREVNQMFYEERKRVQERYKEYDGTYLGHYVQYFFWFFFVLGLVIFGLAIFLMLDSHYHWTK